MSQVLERAVEDKPDERTWPLRTIRNFVEFWITHLNADANLEIRPLWKQISQLSCTQAIDATLTQARQNEIIIRLHNSNQTSAAELEAEKQKLTPLVELKMKQSLNVMFDNVAQECQNASDVALTRFWNFVVKAVENKVWNKSYVVLDQTWKTKYAQLESERDALNNQLNKNEMSGFIYVHWWQVAVSVTVLFVMCLLGMLKFRHRATKTSSTSPQIHVVLEEMETA